MATHRPTLPPNRGARDWDGAIADAKRHVGQWVLIFEQAPRSTPNALTRGAVNVLKDPRWNFELRTRNTNGHRADIWMRATRVTPTRPKIEPRPRPSRAKDAEEPVEGEQQESDDAPPPGEDYVPMSPEHPHEADWEDD